MRSIFTLLLVAITSITFGQVTGIFQTYIVLDSDGSGDIFYAGGANSDLAPNVIGGNNLGTPNSLTLNGGEVKTFKNGGGDVFGAELNYDVHLVGAAASFTALNLPFESNLPPPGDQRWQALGAGIDLLAGLTPGDYELEVYWRSPTNLGDRFDSNFGANHIATFTVPEPDTAFWIGNISDDWETAGNWSTGLVPAPVTIAIVSSAYTLGSEPIIYGDVVSGDITLTNNTLIIKPNASLDLRGLFMNELGNIIIQSDIVNGSGCYLDTGAAGYSGNGFFTVEQSVGVGSTLGQRFFGSPVVSGVGGGLDGTYTGYPLGQLVVDDCATDLLTVTSPYSNLLEWHEDGPFPSSCDLEGWYAISEGGNSTSGRGYSGWMADGATIEFLGEPQNEDNLVPYGPLGYSGVGPANADGWHLLSNPYPSGVIRDAIFQDGFMNPMYHDATSGPYNGTFQPIMVGDNLGVMQGFMAQPMGLTATWSPDDSERIILNGTLKSNEDWFNQKLNVIVNGPNGSDISYLYFNEEASMQFEPYWDCVKKESETGKPTLYSIDANEERLSLNGMNSLNINGAYPLGIVSGSAGQFTFELEGFGNLLTDYTVRFIDSYLNTSVLVDENFEYQVELDDATVNDRFIVDIKSITSIDDSYGPSENSVLFADNELVVFIGIAEGAKNIQVIDALGKVVYKQEGVNDYLATELPRISNGVYFVVLEGNGKQETFKIQKF